jgi:hypothetical protein
MVKRTASVARLGLFFRSRYKASCFRRNRFSAASAPRERSPVLNTVSTSNNTRKEVRKNFASWGRLSMADKSYMLQRPILLSDRIFAEHNFISRCDQSACMNEHRRSRTLSVCRESVFLPPPVWLVKFQDHFGTTKARQGLAPSCPSDPPAAEIRLFLRRLRDTNTYLFDPDLDLLLGLAVGTAVDRTCSGRPATHS